MNEECRNCKFWVVHQRITKFGECHRYPPDPIVKDPPPARGKESTAAISKTVTLAVTFGSAPPASRRATARGRSKPTARTRIDDRAICHDCAGSVSTKVRCA